MKNGWQTKKLGDVCQLISGQHIDAKNYNTESRGVGYLTGPSDFGPLNPIITKWTEHPKIKAKCGDVLITVKGSGVGKINLLNEEEVAISRQLMAIRVTGAEPNFIYTILSSTFDHFQSLSTGAAIPGISREQVLGLKIPFPPLPEQQRIVAILDEAFADLAIAKANAEKNLQNARALFESHLDAVFSQRSAGWMKTTLGEAFDVRDGTHDSPKYHATGYPLITSKNLKRDGLSFDEVKLISEQDYTKINERSAVHKGDVLFAMIGTIGNPTLVEVEPNFAIKNVALFKNPHGHIGAFLKHYLDSRGVISKMMTEAKGTTQRFVGLGYLRNFPINLPSLATQLKLVEELDALSEETQRLARIYEQKLTALDELKQSLLHQAFTGQL